MQKSATIAQTASLEGEFRSMTTEREVQPIPIDEVLQRFFPGVPERTLKELASETGFGSKLGQQWFFWPSDIVGLMDSCRIKSSQIQKADTTSFTGPLPVSAYDEALRLATKTPQSDWRPKLSVVNCEKPSTGRKRKRPLKK
jgi:hypothetical protein